MIDVRGFSVFALPVFLGAAWVEDPAHIIAAMTGGILAAVLVAGYFEWAMRRYQRALDAKLDELRSFDSALSAQAGRISSVEHQLSEIREELTRRRDVPPNWDISPGHRR